MISKFSVRRPYTVFVAVVAVIVIGVVAMMRMNADLLPDMNLPYVMIITTDMGASPEAVERDVTAPIESSLATTSNVKNIQSMSNNSYSTIIVEYEQSANMDATMIEIQQSLDQVKGNFDESIGTPIVMQLNPDMLPIMVAAANVEEMDNLQLSEYIETEILPQLESVEGVASVSATGGITETIQVTMNQKKIDKLNAKIMDEIDDKFADTKDELASNKEQIESGQQAIASGKTTLADTISENKSTLETAQQDLYEKGSELETQRTTLAGTSSTLATAIDGLNQAYEQAKELEEQKAALDSIIPLSINEEGGMLDDATFEQTTGMSYADAITNRAKIEAGLTEINTQVATSGAALSLYGISVSTYEDIPAAVAQLETSKAEVDAGISAIDSGLEQINSGKKQTSDGLQMINKAEIEQSITLAETSATLSQGLAQIQMAEDTVEDTLETTKDAADLDTVLSIETLNNLLIAQNFEMPAGYADSDDGQYLVKVGEDISDAEELADTVLIDLNMDNVGVIKLSDVADVKVVDDSEEVYAKLNGEPGILISFEKQTGYSTGEVTDRVLDKFDSLEKTENNGLNFAVLMNQGVYIDIIVKSILQNMILGAALAILVLIIFLRDIRPTIIIACAIPLSVIFAIVLMYFTKISLNIISMSGLTLGIGMLVDNSIVVIENIYRLRKEGETIKKAAVYGASQVAGAITSSTLTTMCVFLPIVFTDGLTRQLFVDMGLTIAFTLLASLLVALTLVPAMAQGLLKNSKEKETSGDNAFMRVYDKIIRGALRFKPLVFVVMLLLMGASVALALSRGTEFMPEMQSDQVTITLSAPDEEERTFEEMTSYSDQLVEKLQSIDEIETIGAMIGNGSTLGALSGGGDNSVSIYVLLKEDSKLSNDEIVEKINKAGEGLDCQMDVSAELMDMSLLSGSGVSIMIKGRDMQTLQKLAGDAAEILEGVDGIEEVDNGLDNMTQTFVISVNKEKAAEYGMTVAQVFTTVAGELASTQSTTAIETDIKDYDVFVKTDKQATVTIDDLKKLKFEYTDRETNETKDIPLSRIVTFSEQEELSTVLRDNQNRYISVSGTLDGTRNVGIVGNEVQRKINDMAIPEGYSVDLQGENETINDAMRQVLLMMLLAVILIYLIMVAQFQSLKSPFIIMFTIPLAFTGGFFALFFCGKAVSVIAMIGFVMLAGIIVNNGIVLVDYVNQLRREGMGKKEAIVTSAKTRLRPVLMTALTTIISMSTMAIGMGKGVEMSQPMAIVVVGGLVYGTILTLVLVPCLYDAFNKEKDMREEEL